MLIVVQMVPLEALVIPIYLMLDGAGQTDRLAGIIVTYLTFVLPFAIWTLRGFIVNIPEARGGGDGGMHPRRGVPAHPVPAGRARGWSRPRCSPSSWSGTTT